MSTDTVEDQKKANQEENTQKQGGTSAPSSDAKTSDRVTRKSSVSQKVGLIQERRKSAAFARAGQLGLSLSAKEKKRLSGEKKQKQKPSVETSTEDVLAGLPAPAEAPDEPQTARKEKLEEPSEEKKALLKKEMDDELTRLREAGLSRTKNLFVRVPKHSAPSSPASSSSGLKSSFPPRTSSQVSVATALADSAPTTVNSEVHEKSKQEEMKEELSRLRKMRDDIEVQHKEYQARLEKKIAEEMQMKAEVEAELQQTRARLMEEMEHVKEAKEQLTEQIDSLKQESEKKKQVEMELEKIKLNKESLETEIAQLKEESERKKQIEAELEQIRQNREKLQEQMDALKFESEKRIKLETELDEVKEIKERLAAEIAKLKEELQKKESNTPSKSPGREQEATDLQTPTKLVHQQQQQQQAQQQQGQQEGQQPHPQQHIQLHLPTVISPSSKDQQNEEKQTDRQFSTSDKKSAKKRQQKPKTGGTASLGFGLGLKLGSLPLDQTQAFLRRFGDISALGKVFVTGGSGFLGSELVRTLAANGIHITALARSDASAELLLKNGASAIVRGDLLKMTVDELVPMLSGIQVVFHLAAHVNLESPWEICRNTNVKGTELICGAARTAGIQRFVYCSCASIALNVSRGKPVDETLTIAVDPIENPYVKSKASSEAAVRRFYKMGLNTVVLRPAWLWGKNDRFMKTIVEAIKVNSYSWPNGGGFLYSACHVSNCVEALVLAGTKGPAGETYYISDAVPMQWKDFVTRIAATQNVDCSAVVASSGIMETAVSWFKSVTGMNLSRANPGIQYITDHSLVINDKKARRYLEFQSMVSFDKALQALREEFITVLTTPRTGLSFTSRMMGGQ